MIGAAADESKLNTRMRMMCVATLKDKLRNEEVRRRTKVTTVVHVVTVGFVIYSG